jgi:hypothetical protein
MKFSLKYLDSGFYTVSDKAARAIVRSRGQSLPNHGWQKSVLLKVNGLQASAWLIRTHSTFLPTSPRRNWAWALFAFRVDPTAYLPSLGKLAKGETVSAK